MIKIWEMLIGVLMAMVKEVLPPSLNITRGVQNRTDPKISKIAKKRFFLDVFGP